jgi:hypothetical protein
MKDEIPLKEILAAIDLNGKEVWDDLAESQQKQITFFTLNRFISSVGGSRELQEHFLILCNERFNKNFFDLTKHPKLQWLLACSCSHDSKKINYHEYIKIERTKTKKEKFLSELYPHMKLSDIEVLASITSDKEIKDHCKDLGWDDKEIKNIKL